MRKLKLDLDQLAVDSFDTQTPPKREGTVFGEQCSCGGAWSCPGGPTCEATCACAPNPSAGESCGSDCPYMPITHT